MPSNGIPGGIMYPFGMSGTGYRNHNPSGLFEGNWSYNYHNCVLHFPNIQNVLNSCTSVPNTLMTNDVNMSAKDTNFRSDSNENVNSEENKEHLSNGKLSDEIALKLSTMLTDSNLFKSTMSKLQNPTSSESETDKSSVSKGPIQNADSETDGVIDDSGNTVEESAGNQNATVRYKKLNPHIT